MITLKNGTEAKNKRFDRLVQFDERSRNFSIRAVIEQQKPRSYTWSVAQNLDQGSDGACVGFSWTHELIAKPKAITKLTNTNARELYWQAQILDPWPGGSYSGADPIYEGTSVLSGAKAVQRLGYMGEYRWAFGLDDVRMAIGYKGPVVLGLNWYEGMMEPDADGRIRPTGDLMGGHAILANRNDEKNQRVWVHQSWGKNWGLGGKAWLSYDDILKLLHEEGEACIPVVRIQPK